VNKSNDKHSQVVDGTELDVHNTRPSVAVADTDVTVTTLSQFQQSQN